MYSAYDLRIGPMYRLITLNEPTAKTEYHVEVTTLYSALDLSIGPMHGIEIIRGHLSPTI
jgi:hypothetical protein